MSRSAQTLALIFAYTLVIAGTMVWSGKTVEKNLYDKYIIYLEGAILPVGDEKTSTEFYRKVLDFNEVDKKLAQAFAGQAFLITDKKKLYLKASSEQSVDTPVLLVRVRNGFRKLHGELLKRSGQNAQPFTDKSAFANIKRGRVSEIYKGNRGDQFILSDPDGNLMLFYQRRLRLFS